MSEASMHIALEHLGLAQVVLSETSPCRCFHKYLTSSKISLRPRVRVGVNPWLLTYVFSSQFIAWSVRNEEQPLS
jgi:hypothetical protein